MAIDFDVYDAQRNKIASVVKNNIYGANPERYRLDGTADTIKLHEIKAPTPIVTIIKRRDAVPAELEIYVETCLPNGELFSANPDSTNFAGVTVRGVTIQGCSVGINLG